jgi:subtilase family serine protease
MQAVGRLPANSQMEITFGLPLRNAGGLTNFLRQLYQPGNPAYRHYLTPEQFAAAYGPTDEDYQSVINFAKAHHLTVTRTHSNRTLLNVAGAVGDIEDALHVRMNLYPHPRENRAFFAPDAQPSIDLDTPVLGIVGLHNFTLPKPCFHPLESNMNTYQPQTGSGLRSNYLGGDFRAAYAPDVLLTGAGQSVGLVEFGGYAASDIADYESLAHITNGPQLQNILLDGYSGAPSGGGVQEEVDIDIEMAIAMAPGMTNVYVYEGNTNVNTVGDDMLNRMATDNSARQLSCSWTFDIDAMTEQIFQQYAAQGQSFFQASGDYGSYAAGNGIVDEPSDDPNITIVGGTTLATSGPLGSWVSETTWNQGSGGVSEAYPIPYWQLGIDMSANQGSTSMRNLPDVAMVGTGIEYTVNGLQESASGTSFSTPLFAGFMALVNQQAALNNQGPVGFVNPLIYSIGRGTNYLNCFHDITAGGNTNGNSPAKYLAVPGYDLCSGWGTPAGGSLISALLQPQASLVVAPQMGLTAIGPSGGPLSPSSQTYSLSNAGSAALSWAAGTAAPWLSISNGAGSLTAGSGPELATFSLNSSATNLLLGDFSATVSITNFSDGSVEYWPFNLFIGNGGFESGSFTNWILVGGSAANYVAGIDDSVFAGNPLPGISYAQFVHSGLAGAYLSQPGFLASLLHPIPTAPGHAYLLSCWMRTFANTGATNQTSPNEFRMRWNGTTLFDRTNLPASAWTNLQFVVSATNASAMLEFDFRNDPAAFALDDVSIVAIQPPNFQSVTRVVNGTVSLTWSATPGAAYQLQFTTNLASMAWSNLGANITATNTVVTASDVAPADRQRFYRFVVSP